MLDSIIRFIKKWWFVICVVLVVLLAIFWDVIFSYLSSELNSAVVDFINNLFGGFVSC